MPRERDAFILIELLAVLTIVALLASAAHLSLRGVHQQLSFEDVTARIADYERAARAMTRRWGVTARLHIDAATLRVEWADNTRGLKPPTVLTLPAGYSLQAPATILIGSSGRSRSYALRLQGPGQQQQSLIISGLSGQVTLTNNDAEVHDILAGLAQRQLPRADAD